MSIFEQYKKTANTQTNALQSFADKISKKQAPQPFIGPVGMTPYQPTPNMINYATGQSTYAATPAATPKATTSKVATSKVATTPTQSGASYKGVPIDYSKDISQQLRDIDARSQNNIGGTQNNIGGTQSNIGGTQNNIGGTQSNLANTPISTFYSPTTADSNMSPYEDVDEDKIRREVLGRYQSQIDATKASYASLMGETKRLGTGRLGESTAMQARGGLLGSDFGVAQTEGVRGLNLSQEKGVLESEAMAVSNIMAQAMGDAQAEIAAKRAAKQYGYAALQEYNAGEQQRKQANIKKVASAMILQGVDPRTMGSQLKDLAKTYKVSEADIINAYLEEEDLRKESDKFKTIGSDSMLYDPKTGTFIQPPSTQDAGKLVTIGGKEYIQNTDGSFSVPSVPQGEQEVSKTLSQVQFLKDTVQKALELSDAAGRSGIRRNFEGAVIGATNFTQLENYVDTLKTNLLSLATDSTIKKFFGPQMSNADVRLMMAGGTTLDPIGNKPEDLVNELGRVLELFNRMEQTLTSQSFSTSEMGGGEDVFAEEW